VNYTSPYQGQVKETRAPTGIVINPGVGTGRRGRQLKNGRRSKNNLGAFKNSQTLENSIGQLPVRVVIANRIFSWGTPWPALSRKSFFSARPSERRRVSVTDQQTVCNRCPKNGRGTGSVNDPAPSNKRRYRSFQRTPESWGRNGSGFHEQPRFLGEKQPFRLGNSAPTPIGSNTRIRPRPTHQAKAFLKSRLRFRPRAVRQASISTAKWVSSCGWAGDWSRQAAWANCTLAGAVASVRSGRRIATGFCCLFVFL